eukprot:TRINITY_DN2870_c0_g1_i1.p1 TRINITY_DN2870_c0_g1~~TRINITY_DN2870_c0_g1_i1.p1  ORF type:complete len:612 (+),score=172.66 TRINITY_DN2870_c0_g1_i1:72-1838(+)
MEVFACDAGTGDRHVVDVGENLTFKGLKAAIAKLIPVPVSEMLLTHGGVEVGGAQEEEELVGGSAVAAGDELQVARNNTSLKKQLSHGHCSLLSQPPWVRTDRELVEAAVNHDEGELCHASDELRSDKDFLLGLAREGSIHDTTLGFIGESLWDEKEFVMAALQHCPITPALLLIHASQRLRQDREVGLAAIEHHDPDEVIMFLDEKLRSCPEFMLACLAAECGADSDDDVTDDTSLSCDSSLWGSSVIMKVLPDSLRTNVEFMRKAARITSDVAFVAGDAVLSDAEVMGCVVRRTPSLIKLCSDSLRNCDTFMRLMITRHPGLLALASPQLCADPELVLAALDSDMDNAVLLLMSRSDPAVFRHRPLFERVIDEYEILPRALQHCGDELLHDEALMVKVLNEHSAMWVMLPADMRSDKAFVLRCLEEGLSVYDSLGIELQCDPEVVLLAKRTAHQLPFELLNDPEFATRFLSDDENSKDLCEFNTLLGDRAVVFAALRHFPEAMRHARPTLRRDPEVMLEAARMTGGKSLQFIAPELVANVDFYLEIVNDATYVSNLPKTDAAVVAAVAERITSEKKRSAFVKLMQS